ncbi:MAG: hypothetical protein AAF628_13120 [Planctomycetota bacterium]
MKTLATLMCALHCCLGLASAQAAAHRPDVPPVVAAPAQNQPGRSGSAEGAAAVIDFDDRTQPTVFASAVPLHSEYESQGVTFLGRTLADGGAVLDQTSFTVSGYSPPNALAFNTLATLSGGGVPAPPEEIWFRPTVTMVSCNVGGSSGPLTMVAHDPSGAVVARAQLNLRSGLRPIQVTGGCIARVVIDSGASLVVLDDLAFAPGPCTDGPVVSLATAPAGEQLDVVVHAPANSPGVVLLAAGSRLAPASADLLRLTAPVLAGWAFVTSPRREAHLRPALPPGLRGAWVLQAVVVDTASGQVSVSNPSVR